MAATSLQAEGYASMTLAVEAMETAIDGVSPAIAIAVTTVCNVVKIGSGNWGYWVLYS
jgi:hypothetical protein